MSKADKTGRVLSPKVRAWLTDPLPADVRRAVDRLARADDVRQVALMPDVHLAGEVCIGTVLATDRLVYPQAVGSDIGCGMTAVAFRCPAGVVRSEAAARRVLAALPECVPVKRHRSLTSAPPLPATLRHTSLTAGPLVSAAKHEGSIELGTLGRGNHFLEFQADEDDRLWLMVHSGSRAMGQRITQWHMRHALRVAGGLCTLDTDTPEGQAYLTDATWAVDYAEANRRAMAMAIAHLLQEHLGVRMAWDTLFSICHNHVRRESHRGSVFWVHRKGANAAAEAEPGIIPGAMGRASVHVTGRGCKAALCSSSHGAGRILTRQEARQQISLRSLLAEVEDVWFDETVAAGLREEAPSAYRDLAAVLRVQNALVRIIRRLTPILCYKGA
ncbi:MAG: RtcB family protein [Phycisphaerae bacterium]|nr:RtcB family protein [Phycisphaerae bacterium]